MYSASFLTNAAVVANIATAYAANKVIALTAASAVDGTQPALPSGGWLDHLELNVTFAGGATSGTAKLCWDAAGDVLASLPVAFTFEPGVTTTATKAGIIIPFQGWYRNPVAAAQSTMTIYLFVKVNAGTVDVAIGGAKLHGTDSGNR